MSSSIICEMVPGRRTLHKGSNLIRVTAPTRLWNPTPTARFEFLLIITSCFGEELAVFALFKHQTYFPMEWYRLPVPIVCFVRAQEYKRWWRRKTANEGVTRPWAATRWKQMLQELLQRTRRKFVLISNFALSLMPLYPFSHSTDHYKFCTTYAIWMTEGERDFVRFKFKMGFGHTVLAPILT